MADIALASTSSFAPRLSGPTFLYHLAHRAEILRRRARRDRYLALAGRLPRAYPWLSMMCQSMSGR